MISRPLSQIPLPKLKSLLAATHFPQIYPHFTCNPTHRCLSEMDLSDVIERTWNKYFNHDSADYNCIFDTAEIELNTRDENPLWHALRMGRITSTKCHSIKTRLETTSSDALTKNVMGYASSADKRNGSGDQHGRPNKKVQLLDDWRLQRRKVCGPGQ